MNSFKTLSLILMTLVGQASAQSLFSGGRPEWAANYPTDDDAAWFYVGQGEASDLETAKSMARKDAYLKAHTQFSPIQPGDVLESWEQNDQYTRGAYSIPGGKPIPGFSWAGEYCEELPQHRSTSTRCYILAKVRKPAPTFLASTGNAIGGRLDASLHNLILPGWGTARAGREGMGGVFMTAWAVTGLATATTYVLGSEGVAIGGRVPDWQRYHNTAAISFAAVYALALADGLLFGREPKKYSSRLTITPLYVAVNF